MRTPALVIALLLACHPGRSRVSLDVASFAQRISDLTITLALRCPDQPPADLVVERGADGDTFSARAPACGDAVLELGLWRENDGDRIAAGASTVSVTLRGAEVEVSFPTRELGEVEITPSESCDAVLDLMQLHLDAGVPLRVVLALGEHTLGCVGRPGQTFQVDFAARTMLRVEADVGALSATLLDRVDVRLDWSGMAASFRIVLSETPDFAETTIAASDLHSTSHVLTGLADLTTFHAMVQALDDRGNVIATSNAVSFTTGDARPFIASDDLATEYPQGTNAVMVTLVFNEPVQGVVLAVDGGATVDTVTSADSVSWTVGLGMLQASPSFTLTLVHAGVTSVAHGRAALPFSKTFAIAPLRYFVSQAIGDDGNNGLTVGSAFATVPTAFAALNLARQASPGERGEIAVAAGSYDVAGVLNVPANTRVLGGYAPDFAGMARDPSTQLSEIFNNDSTSPAVRVDDPAATLANTELDGFTLHGGLGVSQPVAVALEVAGLAAPRLSRLHVFGGEPASSGTCIGVRVLDSAAPRIEHSTIEMGAGASCTTGIGLSIDTTSAVTVEDNLISGNCPPGAAIAVEVVNAQSVSILRNLIYSGETASTQNQSAIVLSVAALVYSNVIVSGYGYPKTVGVAVHSGAGASTIANNVIDAGDTGFGGQAIGVELIGVVTGSPLIANNVLYHRGLQPAAYGVLETSAAATPRIHNNVFTVADQSGIGGAYQVYMGAQYVNAAAVNAIGPDFVGNFDAPLGVGAVFVTYPYASGVNGTTVSDLLDYDLHLIDAAFFSAGLDLSPEVGADTRDLGGSTRMAPWSIGVYEQ